jgi:DNA polymerase
VKELGPMDNDLPILNKALNDYMLKGIPVETTINNCDELVMFQKISKLTSNYDYVTHNDKKYYNKCYRIFASTYSSDGPVKKIKTGGRADKFANTSENSFIENGDITGVKVPMRLDKGWYINEAIKRLEQYGVY